MPSWTRKSGNLHRWLKCVNIQCYLPDNASLINKNRRAKTSGQNKCWTIFVTKPDRTESLTTRSSAENSMIKKSAFNALKWSFRNQWWPNLNSNVSPPMLKDYKGLAPHSRRRSGRMLLQMINWLSIRAKPMPSWRKRNKSKKSARSLKLRKTL